MPLDDNLQKELLIIIDKVKTGYDPYNSFMFFLDITVPELYTDIKEFLMKNVKGEPMEKLLYILSEARAWNEDAQEVAEERKLQKRWYLMGPED